MQHGGKWYGGPIGVEPSRASQDEDIPADLWELGPTESDWRSAFSGYMSDTCHLMFVENFR